MKTIYKYELVIADEQVIKIPVNSEFLCVQLQNNTPCIWAKVDSEEQRGIFIKFFMVGTGNPMPEEAIKYIGTIQLYNGKLVFHVFI